MARPISKFIDVVGIKLGKFSMMMHFQAELLFQFYIYIHTANLFLNSFPK